MTRTGTQIALPATERAPLPRDGSALDDEWRTRRRARVAARFDFPWTAALVALAFAATALQAIAPRSADWLVADARFSTGDLWRLASGPFIHATWGHLLRDAALIALVGVAYEAVLARVFGWFVAFALVVPTTAVLVGTDASWYCGLSGVSHALFAAALVIEVRQRRGAIRFVVVLLGCVFAAKPLYELITGQPAFPMDLGPDVRQAPLAHAAGVAVGIVFGATTGREGPDISIAAPG